MEQVTLFPYSETQLKILIYNVVKSALSEIDNKQIAPEPPIRGIHELAKFLRISAPRAQQLKNDKIFPYFQNGRTLLFDPQKVRESMQKIQPKK
jgi:hypothetical protein